jgi:hypothetical protein
MQGCKGDASSHPCQGAVGASMSISSVGGCAYGLALGRGPKRNCEARSKITECSEGDDWRPSVDRPAHLRQYEPSSFALPPLPRYPGLGAPLGPLYLLGLGAGLAPSTAGRLRGECAGDERRILGECAGGCGIAPWTAAVALTEGLRSRPRALKLAGGARAPGRCRSPAVFESDSAGGGQTCGALSSWAPKSA